MPPLYETHHEAIIRGPGASPKYPFRTMVVGDVFYVPMEDGKHQFSRMYSARRYWRGKFPDREWDIHVVSVGLRVQRVE